MKRMIFHIPQYIESGSKSGSQLRPMAMLEAFKAIGYHVDIVMGYGEDRKRQIKRIKENIQNGIQYEFMYSESSTMPTLLTEKDHVPRYPFLDFGFFRFCKEHGIKIGLFYRDVFWRFDLYRKKVPFLKRLISIPLYHYDLKMYEKWLNVLFLPSMAMYKYIPIDFKGKIEPLPPALNKKAELLYQEVHQQNSGHLKIFYVGGISDLYNIEKLFEVVQQNERLQLTVCCRENEWEKEKSRYQKYMNDRIQIVHKSGIELEPYYQQADILNLFLEPIHYWEFVMPVKLFEYLGHAKPIIAVKGTASGEFVEENNIGWTIEYSSDLLNQLLTRIYMNPKELMDKKENMKKIQDANTWEARARKVAKELTQ